MFFAGRSAGSRLKLRFFQITPLGSKQDSAFFSKGVKGGQSAVASYNRRLAVRPEVAYYG
jgi:hypothetical protein